MRRKKELKKLKQEYEEKLFRFKENEKCLDQLYKDVEKQALERGENFEQALQRDKITEGHTVCNINDLSVDIEWLLHKINKITK